MKKILFVTNQLVTGGIETALLETIKLIKSDNIEITVATMNSGGNLLPEFQKVCKIKDFSIEYKKNSVTKKQIIENIKHFQTFKLLKNTFKFIRNRFIFSRYKEKITAAKNMPKISQSYDIAIAYFNPYTLIDIFTANNVTSNAKYLWIHADVSKYLTNTNVEKFESCFLAYDKIICVSKNSENSLLSRHPSLNGKTQVVYNPIDTARIISLAKERLEISKKDEIITICSVGRLSKEKGFDIAVKALKLLKSKNYKIQWLICGDGGEKENLEKKIFENNLQDNLILLGNQNNPYPYINCADIYVQTSRFESYCITLAEARVLKKPIVTTNFPCACEHVIDGHNGFICEMTPESIADAIEKLILSPELREKFSQNTTPVDSDYSKLKELFN